MIEPQYRPHAYVSGKGSECVNRIGEIGTVTFSWIYQHRPPDCRYAVAGTWSAQRRAEDVIVWDLYHVMKNVDGSLITPDPVGVHTDVDAAVMATAMLYEND